jgi:hypothetical protein
MTTRWNDPTTPARLATVPELFIAQVRRTPEDLAHVAPE